MGPHFFTEMKKFYRKNVIVKSCVIEEGMFSIERNTILVHIRQDIAVFLIFSRFWAFLQKLQEKQKIRNILPNMYQNRVSFNGKHTFLNGTTFDNNIFSKYFFHRRKKNGVP